MLDLLMPMAPPTTVRPDELILEGIVVSCDQQGQPNIAPMGPRVARDLTRFVLKPFHTSQTYQNLKTTRCSVFHVIDDVELLAHAATGQLLSPPALVPIDGFNCSRLADCCRWFALEVQTLGDSAERANMECRVVAHGDVRSFLGFNRAKHAVLEAAILATRIGIIADHEIRDEIQRLAVIVHKTAGNQERNAFDYLQTYITKHLSP
jgi:hypothetical protein